ncbi:MAG TPA: hypothetical protein VN493_15950 [Thermoanaerobaculia bacterium]|nr:hypothetical protein [Thermoanaerobaculia bacterium]
MTRSTLRCAAGILLAVTFLLPGMAAAREIPSGWLAEPVFSLARLWSALVNALPDGWKPAVASAEGDNGWQLDPDGKPAPGANNDNGWQLDPNG